MHIRPRFFALLSFLLSEVVGAQSWKYDLNPYQASYSGGFSIIVLLIAAAHALPILAIASTTSSKIFTGLTAIVMAFVAVVLGGGVYAIADLLFVAIGTYFGFSLCKSEPTREPSLIGLTQPEELPKTKHEELPTTTLDERRAELIRLAESNDAKSQLALGELLLEGDDSEFNDIWFPRDIERGLFWIKRAIAAGEGNIHSLCLFFYDELTRNVKMDAGLLDQFADAVSFLLQYDQSIENVTIHRGLITAQQTLASGDIRGAYDLVSDLRSDYFAKHVKGG